jgi:hypothetical protein
MLRDLSMSASGKLHRSNNDRCGCRLWAERGPRLNGPLLLCSDPKTSSADTSRLKRQAVRPASFAICQPCRTASLSDRLSASRGPQGTQDRMSSWWGRFSGSIAGQTPRPRNHSAALFSRAWTCCPIWGWILPDSERLVGVSSIVMAQVSYDCVASDLWG